MSLLGGSLWAEIITSFCCSIRPMFSVTCGLNFFFCLYLLVISVCVVFIFYNRYSCFYLPYLFFFFKGIFHLGVLISRTHTSRLHVIYRMGVRLLFFICWMQFWDYEHLMYTLNILLLNVTGLNSAVKRTCVLEYLHRKSISGALICNTASSGIFSPCVLGVSCGHGSVDACRPGFVFHTADWLLCWYKCVSSWNLMQRRRLFAGFAAARRTMM